MKERSNPYGTLEQPILVSNAVLVQAIRGGKLETFKDASETNSIEKRFSRERTGIREKRSQSQTQSHSKHLLNCDEKIV